MRTITAFITREIMKLVAEELNIAVIDDIDHLDWSKASSLMITARNEHRAYETATLIVSIDETEILLSWEHHQTGWTSLYAFNLVDPNSIDKLLKTLSHINEIAYGDKWYWHTCQFRHQKAFDSSVRVLTSVRDAPSVINLSDKHNADGGKTIQ